MTSRNLILFFIIVVLYNTQHQFHMADAGTIAPSLSASRNIFAANIFQKIAPDHVEENVIFSPASIQSCLTLAFLGAEGGTAKQMREVLVFGEASKEDIGAEYGEFFNNNFGNERSENFRIKMANRVYVNEKLKISSKFNEIARKNLNSEAESVNFSDPPTATNHINSWVSQETNNRINNLLQPGSINGGTSAILINAIYFKAKWLKPFSESSTATRDFFTSQNKKIGVDTMYMNEDLKYADLPEYDATALELPYSESDLTMLILLPNKNDGLQALEKSLSNVDLNEITSKMEEREVDVFMPKFKIEQDLDLKEPLIKLGLTDIFSEAANFTSLFADNSQHKVDEVKHKAFLDVNEAGSEAAAATYIKIVPMMLNLNLKVFDANHPFLFFIRNSKTVFFAGHVANF